MQLGGNPQWQREKTRIAEMYRAEVEQVQREYRRQMQEAVEAVFCEEGESFVREAVINATLVVRNVSPTID